MRDWPSNGPRRQPVGCPFPPASPLWKTARRTRPSWLLAPCLPVEEFGRVPPPNFLEEALEQGSRHQAAEREAARRRKENAR
jgi:hypothetical protein